MQSDTYRAIQEEQHFGGPRVHEIPITVQHQTYQPAAGAGKVKIYRNTPNWSLLII